MPFRLFSLIAALVVAITLIGCQTRSHSSVATAVAHQDPHPPMPHIPSDSLSGIWTGAMSDMNNNERLAIEWTVGEMGNFTGMAGPMTKEGASTEPGVPMEGSVVGDTLNGSISVAGDSGQEGRFDGTILRSGDTMTGTVIIRPNNTAYKRFAMKIRLEREPQ